MAWPNSPASPAVLSLAFALAINNAAINAREHAHGRATYITLHVAWTCRARICVRKYTKLRAVLVLFASGINYSTTIVHTLVARRRQNSHIALNNARVSACPGIMVLQTNWFFDSRARAEQASSRHTAVAPRSTQLQYACTGRVYDLHIVP